MTSFKIFFWNGVPTNRSFCYQTKDKILKFCIKSMGTKFTGQCHFDELVKQMSIWFPTVISDSHSSHKAEALQLEIDCHSSKLAKAMVVPRTRPPSLVQQKKLLCTLNLLSKMQGVIHHPNGQSLNLLARLLSLYIMLT